MTRIGVFGGLVAMAMLSGTARADDGADFLKGLAGTWSGSGAITTDAKVAASPTHCALRGTPSASGVVITGSCDGAARGANLAVDLSWSAAQRQVFGTFQGGAETGTARLSGRISGQSLQMQVTSSDGTTSRLTLTRSGPSKATMTVSGKDAKSGKSVVYVRLSLAKG